jgi:hypothetical protein
MHSLSVHNRDRLIALERAIKEKGPDLDGRHWQVLQKDDSGAQAAIALERP